MGGGGEREREQNKSQALLYERCPPPNIGRLAQGRIDLTGFKAADAAVEMGLSLQQTTVVSGAVS